MANRAYLYATDFRDRWDWREFNGRHEQMGPYWDSRHNIPLAWWFFFAPGDAFLIAKVEWSEVRLLTDRLEAVRRFYRRRKLLEDVVGKRISYGVFDVLAASIERRSGKYLAMNPDEISGEYDDKVCDDFNLILTTIAEPSTSASKILSVTQQYSNIDPYDFDQSDPDGQRALLRIVGTNYDDHDLWNQYVFNNSPSSVTPS